MGRPLHPILFPLGLLLALCILSGDAAAHAALVSSDPPRNSQLHEAPAELLLRFSEPFENDYTRVEVTDEDGARYDRDNVFEGDNTRIRVPLDPMPDGIYFVHWRTLGTDTHTLQGQYLLAVNVTFGDMEVPRETASGDGRPEEGFGAEVAVRTLGFFAGSVVAGISLFVLVLPRGDPLDAARRAHHRLTAVAGGLAALAALLLLIVLARRIDGTVLDAARTGSGTWIAVRGAAFAGAGIVAWGTERWGGHMRRDDLAVAALGFVGLLATTMASHAAAEPSFRGLAIAADLLHLVAVAFWLGGLALLAVLLVERTDPATMFLAVQRFSPLAMLGVVAIVLTGGISSALRILSLQDLVDTLYGRALLLKILLLVPLVALGAFNRFYVQPRLKGEAPERATKHLRRSVLGEVAMMVVTLVAAATLATVAPPDALADASGDSGRFDEFRGVIATFEADGHRFTVRALPEPLTVGPQEITVRVEKLDPAAGDVTGVILILRSPSQGETYEGDAVPLEPDEDGIWRLEGFILSETGTWHNDILVQGSRVYEVHHLPMFVV